MTKTKKFIPLEANPDVLTRFAGKLGLDTKKLQFCDVFGLDEEVLAFVPQPVCALLLLFPVSPAYDAESKKVDEQQSQAGAVVSPDVFYMKQTISNACGTIGVLHAIGNNLEAANLREDSFLKEFFQATAGMSAEERGAYLEEPPNDAPSIDEAHLDAAMEGDTRPQPDQDVSDHFVALVNHKGRLLELDGRKRFPVDHGPTCQGDLLKDAAVVARKFMDKIDSLNFNLIALAAPAQ